MRDVRSARHYIVVRLEPGDKTASGNACCSWIYLQEGAGDGAWIKGEISDYLSHKGKSIRLTDREYRKLQRLKACIDKLKRELGRQPAAEEIAFDMAVSIQVASEAIALLQNLTFESFDAQTGDEQEEPVESSIPASSEDQPELIAEAIESVEFLKKMMNVLKERDQQILDLHFGLSQGKEWTLEEIGVLLGICKQRVSQIKASALRKLKTDFGDAIEDYLD
ncbi:MAG TPA: sigma-70 family RNA polymerase sigma factor [Candidatus Obscuribacterales bacterium]